MRDTVLVVGNGLSIDLRIKHRTIGDSSYPLSINVIPKHHFNGTEMADLDFKVYYPHLIEVLRNFGCEVVNVNHFNVINSIINADINDEKFSTEHVKKDMDSYYKITNKVNTWWSNGRKKGLAISQLRLYLIYVFSFIDQSIEDDYIKEWRWTKWINHSMESISQVVSFNYDITLDRAANMLSNKDYVLSKKDIRTRINPIMISKPHGSINYTIDNVIDSGQLYWDMPARNSIYELNQGQVSVIERNNLYRSREFSDMVLPTEAPG